MRYFKYTLAFLQIFILFSAYSVDIKTIKTFDHFIKNGKDNTLYLKEKSIEKGNAKNRKERVVILLPPLCIPSGEAYDIPSLSFMDELAKKGFDVFSVDFEGMGKSTYPKVMQIFPAPTGVFPLQSADAVKQLNIIIDYIHAQKKVQDISLIGWSFGSIVAAEYASLNQSKINKLVLTGAMHSFNLPLFTKPFADKENQFNNNLSAYQIVPWEAIYSHWKMMMQEKNLVSKYSLLAVEKVYKNLDSGSKIHGSLRRPMGPMKDLFQIWTNHPVYDITKISQPTLVINGDQDIFADKELFKKLTGVKSKKEIVIKNATHWIIYEDNRKVYIDEIISFLNKKENYGASY
ncbi:alpha/beta hydrolase [Fluviispira multicolorata]|uniref:Alpha/beta fold hydrolase n=1 Tax=Fluviispira multicolorata TaxID=2654512 RepID=A0A833N5L2_9BACT|nr:alpha/beta hydrolase [Fluviispira multicolorata]KAB8028061.1 alpha/beta fold hydrolase [Fluviispira multicolorata]